MLVVPNNVETLLRKLRPSFAMDGIFLAACFGSLMLSFSSASSASVFSHLSLTLVPFVMAFPAPCSTKKVGAEREATRLKTL